MSLRFLRGRGGRLIVPGLGFVPLVMLLHNVLKLLALFGRQLAANLLTHVPELLADRRADLVPDNFHSLLAVVKDGLDVPALFGSQVELILHPTQEVAQLAFARHGEIIFDRGAGARWQGWLSEVDGQSAGDHTGREYYQRSAKTLIRIKSTMKKSDYMKSSFVASAAGLSQSVSATAQDRGAPIFQSKQ